MWHNEWQSLQQWYTSEDKQVCLLKIEVQDGVQYTSSPGEQDGQNAPIIFPSSLECCYECASMRLASEDAQAKDFGEADIYVFKCEAGDAAVCYIDHTLQSLK